MSDAISDVVLMREDIDASNGKPGIQVECMNAQCGLRSAKAFNHPVYMIEFRDTRAWVVDKLDAMGMPAHCIRYYHHEGDEQKEFDAKGGKRRLIKSGRVRKTITLYAPTNSVKHIANPNPRKRVEKGRTKRDDKNKLAFARFVRAGILAA
jgi:hypothetical protein